MKFFRMLAISAVFCTLAAAQSNGWSTLVQRFSARQLIALGVPLPPNTPDALVVFVTGCQPNTGYSVQLSYEDRSGSINVVIQHFTSFDNGLLRAAFTVPDATAVFPLAWAIAPDPPTPSGN